MTINTIIASPHHLAETIEEVTSQRVLEIYREEKIDIAGAQAIDGLMVDLSKRIIEAISQVPEPDEYEIWLRERTCLGCSVADLKPKENEPVLDPDKNTREASIDPDAEPRDKSRTPIDGGDPDTQPAVFKESDETTTKAGQPPAAGPSGDAVSGAAAVQADTPKNQEPSLQEKVLAWKVASGLSNDKLGKLAKTSGITISNIMKGGGVRKSTVKNVTRAIRTWNKKAEPAPAKEKEPEPAVVNGASRGPGQYIQLKLIAWMEHEHIGLAQASSRLMVQEEVLRAIKLHAVVPHENIINQLVKYVPGIKAERTMLMAAAERRDH